MSEWISVEERLPDLNKNVLCCGKQGGVFIGRIGNVVERDDGTIVGYWYFPNLRGHRNPVYWMDIPETPMT